MSGADDATCMVGLVVINGQEIPVRVDTIGVMHVLRQVSNEETRLEVFRRSAQLDPKRELKSLRQCMACSTVYIEQIDENGQMLLMEFRPSSGQLPDAGKVQSD